MKEPLSVYVRLAHAPSEPAPGWESVSVDGMVIFRKYVSLETRGRIFSITLPYYLDPQIHLFDSDSSGLRTLPWIWFFRDYCGQDPTPVSEKPNESSPQTTVALVDTIRDWKTKPSLAVARGRGMERHLFRIVERHPALGSLVEGSKIPFDGGFEPVQVDGYIPLIADEKGRPCVSVSPSPGRAVLFGFDPIYSLWHSSRVDLDAASTATNVNWIPVLLRAFTWTAPFAVWKGLWPGDIPPVIYTVDTEAGSGYYDRGHGCCVWSVGRKFARNRLDMKTESSVRTAARRLERYGLVGSFLVDLNAVLDDKDLAALKEVGRQHDVSLHLPRIGDHEAWKRTATDQESTRAALRDAVRSLTREIGQPLGFRYPSWYRTSSTHDLIAEVGLGYDSSSFAHPPFLVVPYRMFSSLTGEPLDLWEFPCREVIGAVKAGPKFWEGFRTRGRHAAEIRQYVRSCADASGLIVMCDHDMALGAARRHVHGTWRLDAFRSRSILRTFHKMTISRKIRPVRGSDFLRWWTSTRRIRLEPRSQPISGGSALTVSAQESSEELL